MRMVKQFSRSKGAGDFPALGSDGDPGVPPITSPNEGDNALSQGASSDAGWPAHRIAVTYKGPDDSVALVGQVWTYDYLTTAWYEVGAPVTMTPNRVSYFDIASLINVRSSVRDPDAPTTQGSIEICLVVQGDDDAPDGTYTFAMGADLTTLP